MHIILIGRHVIVLASHSPTLSSRTEVIEEDTAEQLNRHSHIDQDTSKVLVKILSIRRNDGLNLFSSFREKKKPVVSDSDPEIKFFSFLRSTGISCSAGQKCM